ncbi:MAG: sugar ABC transporter permease [Opitutaceae bacterium]|nr:sugar ABC transporter permease [Opitutaceae bacterium]MBP9911835.1 sugar ABC transporter permease [Opitutaceae bacterium]
MSQRRSDWRRLLTGLGFLLPNILGFLAFTLVPLGLSFFMAFTDWDILRHNIFRQEPLRFVGLDNFLWLFHHPEFGHYLANTFYLMLGLPFAIAGSLGAALLLTRIGRRPAALRGALVIATLLLIASGLVLRLGGMSETGVLFIFGLLAATTLVAGVFSGGTLYRTLFYLPNFTAGVATFVLWKKLYNPQTGPINLAFAPVLENVAAAVRAMPVAVAIAVPVGCGVAALLLGGWQLRRLRGHWDDVAAGPVAVITGLVSLALPLGFFLHWMGLGRWLALAIALLLLVAVAAMILRRPRPWGPRCARDAGLSAEIALVLGLVPLLTLFAAGVAMGSGLPAIAAAGIVPPNWLGDYAWAKPALIIMGLWAAIGSNNMILYLAGLSNIPPELYEAADMDGASAMQRFWHITWPQLAPVTFFIGVMGVIYGLQGGFEMARVMTLGGPAGSTTTLSYFIYIEGFETGRLGYASAAAWVLFALVFILSLLNFRFGNRNAND